MLGDSVLDNEDVPLVELLYIYIYTRMPDRTVGNSGLDSEDVSKHGA